MPVLDPADNYLVFDELAGMPAEIGDIALIGLSKADALLLCHLLNGGRRPSSVFLRALISSRRAR